MKKTTNTQIANGITVKQGGITLTSGNMSHSCSNISDDEQNDRQQEASKYSSNFCDINALKMQMNLPVNTCADVDDDNIDFPF